MNQYEKLKKIVNEINHFPLKEPEQANWYKLKLASLLDEEITLQDLLLAFKKTKGLYYTLNDTDENIFCFIYIENHNNSKYSKIKYDLSQPLSNQKEEVYNKLIEILK